MRKQSRKRRQAHAGRWWWTSVAAAQHCRGHGMNGPRERAATLNDAGFNVGLLYLPRRIGHQRNVFMVEQVTEVPLRQIAITPIHNQNNA